jgi:hypothetical protein
MRQQLLLWGGAFLVLSSSLIVLSAVVRSGFDKKLSRTSRFIRIVGGLLWAAVIVFGVVMKLLNARQ